MIFRETASVCALPAPVKPKRCFRSPFAIQLGLTFPIAFSIWAMKQQEILCGRGVDEVGGSWKMCRFPQPDTGGAKVVGGECHWVCRKKLKHYLHFSYDTTTIYYRPSTSLSSFPARPLLSQPRRLSTLQPEDVVHAFVVVALCHG